MTLREQLIRDEGCKLKVYRDSVGKLTIGVGRNLEDKGISQQEADAMLDNDIRDFTADVLVALPWSLALDPVRLEALVNIAFNVGSHGLMGFRQMLLAMRGGDWYAAAAHLMDSKAARQNPERYERLAEQFRLGERQ